MTATDYSLEHILALLVCCLLCLFSPQTASPQEKRLHLEFGEETLSANIDNTPLRAVLDALKEQKGISFEIGTASSLVLDEEISLQFEELPLEDALDRILARTNHCMFFEGDSVKRVLLFGKAAKRRYTGTRRIRKPRRAAQRGITRRSRRR